MLAGIWAAVASQPAADLQIDYQSQTGLQVRYRGVPLVRGSFFQYYEEGWTRGYYSSNWNPQTVSRENGAVRVEFRSPDGRATGELKFTPTADGFRSDYTFRWGGDAEVMVENTLGFLWSPAWVAGRLSLDGGRMPLRSMIQRPARDDSVEARSFGQAAVWRFDAPIAALDLRSAAGGPFTVFDARGYAQDWADNRDLFWAGWAGLRIPANGSTTVSAEWRFGPSSAAAPAIQPARAPEWSRLHEAVGPFSTPAPLLPTPKAMESLGPGVGAVLRGRRIATRGDGLSDAAVGEFAEVLGRRFAGLAASGMATPVVVERDGSLSPGGYALRIDGGRIAVRVRDDVGGRMALHTLARLARIEGGRVVLPRVSVRDYPSAPWRGVHMFVGPQAPAFHRRLVDRLFGPLGFSHVVLQCEDADWQAKRGTETSQTMSRTALKAMFDDYRAAGIEPIPLIQSWGHMRWLFNNGRNRQLAWDPDDAFAIDPRKPEARRMVEALWDEAIDLLRPETIHVGLDEVDLRGRPIPPKEATAMWTDYVGWLGALAERHGVRLMLWGDKMLAPGEAPDATHGANRTESKARRAAVPKGTFVADWHYKNDPNPDIYTSLDLLKGEGLVPIASTWYRPGNIVGFFRAAQQRGMGGLQTTWAGYVSHEENLLSAEDQFASYVLAGDQLWSGRHTDPARLGYDAKEMVYRLVYAPPTPMRPVSGWSLGDPAGAPFAIGDVRFRPLADGALFYALDGAGARQPVRRSWPVGRSVREVVLALHTRTTVDGSQEVGRATLTFGDGRTQVVPLRYGRHVRSVEDRQGTLLAARDAQGRSAVRIEVPPGPRGVASVTVESTAPEAGLVVTGLTVR